MFGIKSKQWLYHIASLLDTKKYIIESFLQKSQY